MVFGQTFDPATARSPIFSSRASQLPIVCHTLRRKQRFDWRLCATHINSVMDMFQLLSVSINTSTDNSITSTKQIVTHGACFPIRIYSP